ncbi:hypothetical protein AB0M20_22605, partial [Actinoplanes sp. NPDC051633]
MPASIGSPLLWIVTIAILLALLTVDFILTRRPHDVPMREAVGWTVFYLALPVAFGLIIWPMYGGDDPEQGGADRRRHGGASSD